MHFTFCLDGHDAYIIFAQCAQFASCLYVSPALAPTPCAQVPAASLPPPVAIDPAKPQGKGPPTPKKKGKLLAAKDKPPSGFTGH